MSEFTRQLLRDNAWWEVRLRKLPDDPCDLWDVWLERNVVQLATRDLVEAYDGMYYAMSKRPLSPSETKLLLRKLRRGRKR